MRIITLLTDFGQSDGYVAAMKGVILGIAPQTHIVDVSHQVAPQAVRQAAFVLNSILPYYPPGTIHVVVVDPGVGSQRRAIALRADDAFFVGPDNGVFSAQLSHIERSPTVVRLDNPAYQLPVVSHTFHGRDIFAPAAAHLAAGVPLQDLGSPITDPISLSWPQPMRRPDGSLWGEIIHVDHFGNLISNLPASWLAGHGWHFQVAGHWLPGPSVTYASVQPGQLLALIGSSGQVEIAVREGSAARTLGVRAGEPILAQLHATL